jgi:chromosome segregation protein
VVGVLVEHLEIEAGAEQAVAAGLGDALRAVVVDAGAAHAAIEQAKAGDVHALLLVVDAAADDALAAPLVPAGTRPLADLVRCTHADLAGALRRLLARTVLVDAGWERALEVATTDPGVVAVTREGDRFGGDTPWRLAGESAPQVTPAALAAAVAEAAASEQRRAGAETERVAADAALATARNHVHDAQEARLARAGDLERRSLEVAARRRDLEVRAAALEERRSSVTRRLGSVEGRLAGRDPEAQEAAQRRRAALADRQVAYAELDGRLRSHLEQVDALHRRLREQRRQQSESAKASGERLDALRTERAQLEQQLAETRELLGRSDVDEAETRMRLEAAVERLRVDFDCEPAVALDAPKPEVPEGTTLAGRARELERELRMLGPINPLALQEHEALSERHTFLQQQLDDVKESRRELMRVIRAVDREIVRVFQAAFEDVAEHFQSLFSTLFPGGSGKLMLTDPDDLLETGIEIEARPSGKNVRRLSLLSGGERSLTALAFLFSVFRARPSPFYLLDEVEAALDDVNLHRFLDLVHEFRDEAQLLIVSHQKRTMEAGDCLYGVSMPPGGSSRVVSQRIDDVPAEQEQPATV